MRECLRRLSDAKPQWPIRSETCGIRIEVVAIASGRAGATVSHQARIDCGVDCSGEITMHYLYGLKKNSPRRLVATFGSEQQLLAYVRWATLQDLGNHRGKLEQGSALASYDAWEQATEPLTDDDASDSVYNPSPSML
jgi:hypothetical protein